MHLCRGFSLISMLVGLALSMIAMMTLMAGYRQVVLNAQTQVRSGQSRAEVASTLLTTAQLVQQAGWGVAPTATPPGGTANTDIVLLSAAAVGGGSMSGTAVSITSTTAAGNALVWDTAIAGTTQCHALVAGAGGVGRYGPVNCTNASGWASLAWGDGVTLIQGQSLASTPQFRTQIVSCWPFGTGPGGPQVATRVDLVGFGSSTPSLCLPNISK